MKNNSQHAKDRITSASLKEQYPEAIRPYWIAAVIDGLENNPPRKGIENDGEYLIARTVFEWTRKLLLTD
jgi:hypothetical protein